MKHIHITVDLCGPFDLHCQFPSHARAGLMLHVDGVLVGGWFSSPDNDSARWAAEAIKALHPDSEIETRFMQPESEAAKWWESVKRFDVTKTGLIDGADKS